MAEMAEKTFSDHCVWGKLGLFTCQKCVTSKASKKNEGREQQIFNSQCAYPLMATSITDKLRDALFSRSWTGCFRHLEDWILRCWQLQASWRSQLRLHVVTAISRRQTQVRRAGLSILVKFLAFSGVLYLKQTSCIPEWTRVYGSWRTSTNEWLSISLLQHCYKLSIGIVLRWSSVIGFSSPGCNPWQQVASERWCGFRPGRIEETTSLCIVCDFVMWASRSLDS